MHLKAVYGVYMYVGTLEHQFFHSHVLSYYLNSVTSHPQILDNTCSVTLDAHTLEVHARLHLMFSQDVLYTLHAPTLM